MDLLNTLPKNVINDINGYALYIKDYLEKLNIKYSLFLFGSIAKFNYSSTSDIDLLLLVDIEFDNIRECKKFKYELLFDSPSLSRELDLKVYSRNHFNSTTNFFENSIKRDLIELR